jgi:soluble lytic murein transglycosylase
MAAILLVLLTVSLFIAPLPAGSPDPSSPPAKQRSPTLSVDEQPEPTAIPTVPPPPQLMDRALQRRSIGDDDGTAQDLRTFLNHYPDATEDRKARYYLAESYARRQRWTSAVEAFKDFVAEPVQDTLTPPALFWLARGYEEAGNWQQAAAVYEHYRDLKTPLEPYATMRQAAQLKILGRLPEAARLYELAAASDINRAERAGSFEKAIAIYREIGDSNKALALYDSLLQLAEIPEYRARILYEGASLARDLGRMDQALPWLQEILALAPTSPQAVSVVDELLEGGALSAGEAARVLFANGYHTKAMPLFDAAAQHALPANTAVVSDTDVLELQRLRAMNLRETGHFSQALELLATVSTFSPESEPGRQAKLDWIQTLGQSGETRAAANAYRDYASMLPDDPRAPVALDRAAQLFDRLGDQEAAFHTRMELERRYPDNDLSPYVLHSEALYLFRTRRYAEAQNIWQQIAEGRTGYLKALGTFWAARCARSLQNLEQAGQLFTIAFQAAPESYYGTRAAEELALPYEPRWKPGEPIMPEHWRALEAWVAGWAGQDGDDATVPEVVTSGFVLRATGLSQVGLHAESIGEWNSGRDQWETTPLALVRLARAAHENEVPYIALKVAEQLRKLVPADAPPPPDTLLRLIYPTPYSELMLEEARIWGIDPRLVYALIRQESLFYPYATSWVGARGLGQVMPSTGEGIARQLEVEGFHIDDLYRPSVSVRFGTYYIDQQIASMNGSIHGGLAAYNGGLGNAMRWAEGDVVHDADVFAEIIDYRETRNYVKLVYGYFGVYQRMYAYP